MADQQQRIDLDLDGLVARYGRKLAQAELEAEVASQRADRAERALQQLAQRVSELEADSDVEELTEEALGFEGLEDTDEQEE